jgi:hypothetical protein
MSRIEPCESYAIALLVATFWINAGFPAWPVNQGARGWFVSVTLPVS